MRTAPSTNVYPPILSASFRLSIPWEGDQPFPFRAGRFVAGFKGLEMECARAIREAPKGRLTLRSQRASIPKRAMSRRFIGSGTFRKSSPRAALALTGTPSHRSQRCHHGIKEREGVAQAFNPEPRLPQFLSELHPPVAADMVTELVVPAPQMRMSRGRQDELPAGFEDPVPLQKGTPVVANMFQDLGSNKGVKGGVLKGEVHHGSPTESGPWHPLMCLHHGHGGRVDPIGGIRLPGDGLKEGSCPTTHVQHAAAATQPLPNQPVLGHVPPVGVLDVGELLLQSRVHTPFVITGGGLDAPRM